MYAEGSGDESEGLLGGGGAVATRWAWLKGTVFEQVRVMYSANRAKTIVLARSFFNPMLFSKPADQSEALVRIRANWSMYKLFYGVVYVVVLVYTILSSPLLLLGLAASAGSWGYMFVLHDAHTVVKLGGYELGRREKLLVLVPFTLLVIAITGALSSLVWVAFVASILSLPHAVMHQKPEMDALDELEIEAEQVNLRTTQSLPLP